MRSPLEAFSLAICAASLISTSCIFAPGRPWGEVEVKLDADFAPEANRLDQARLITAKDYAVALDEVRVSFGELFLVLSETDGALSFDPADPPPGYTLCHDGECHHDDGRIVSWAQVEAELAGSDAKPAGLALVVDAERALGSAPVALPAACDPCSVDRGTLALAELRLRSVAVRGTAFDRRMPARIDAAGVPFELLVAVDAPVVAALSIPVERFEPVEIALALRFSLSPQLLDSVDFAELDPDAALDDELSAAIVHDVVEGSILKAGASGTPGADMEDAH